MKKVLEADLLSLAHRVLQMKNRTDVNNLYNEAKLLYEKLLILKFYEDHLNQIQPEISEDEINFKLSEVYTEKNEQPHRKQMPEDLIEDTSWLNSDARPVDQHVEHVQNHAVKEETLISDTIPHEEVTYTTPFETESFQTQEEKVEIITFLENEIELNEVEPKQTLFDSEQLEVEESLNQHLINGNEVVSEDSSDSKVIEDSFFGIEFQEVDFVRVEEIPVEQAKRDELIFEPIEEPIVQNKIIKEDYPKQNFDKPRSLNDAFGQNISVGLNDKIAFENHLFNGSSEDFQRVLSQLNTYNTMEEAQAFIDDLVKPDYNNWQGKEEYAQRFMELIEKRFS